MVPFVYWVSRFLLRLLFLIYLKAEVVGTENLPRRGGVIIVANHLHNADPGIVGVFLRRRVVFMAKAEMFEWPVWGFYVRLIGAFPVRRFEADLAALRKASQIVSKGGVLVMFPEGTRSETATMAQGHPGTALVALRSGVSILPIGITGTEAIHIPQTLFRPLFGRLKVRMVVGKPFFLPPQERINTAAVERCTEIIMRQVASLLPAGYRGVYGEGAEVTEEAAPQPTSPSSVEPTGTSAGGGQTAARPGGSAPGGG